MAQPDFTFKAGDTGPAVTDTLTFSDGSPAPLTGATVTFQMRSLTSSTPLTLTGTTSITNIATAAVSFTPSVADTSQPAGAYMAAWNVVYQSGQTQTFPSQGYIWGVIEPSLTSETQQLVSLPEVKDYLNLNPADRTHDNKLLGLIEDAQPIIEAIVGPVITRTFDEWHTGGQTFIQLRRRPSFAIGTTPVLQILACDEYRGPIKYTLNIVGEPTAATIYSIMLDPRTGTIYRRSTGGGIIPFAAGPSGGLPQAVHVTYIAGQAQVPRNVRRAVLEACRDFYETTMATGIGSRTISDEYERSAPTAGFGDFLDRHARQALRPMRKHPAVA